MAGNLKAFENLKENENASLSSQEKADLRKISPEDIRSQKEKVWDKAFTVDGKSMKLKDIVKNLTFDWEGEKAELEINGKKVAIGWQSELWAAIQVYAIANNKTIGRAGIDGKVWRDTVRWLQSTQNKMAAEKKENKEPTPESWDKLDVNQLDTHNFTPEFNALKKTQRFQEMWVLKQYWELNIVKWKYWKVLNDKGECQIYYKSKEDGLDKKISVKVDLDVNNKIDSKALAKKIVDIVEKSENVLAKEKKENNIVNSVESFDVRKLSPKSQAYLKKKNFILNNKLDLKDGMFSWTWIAFDSKWNLHFGDAFIIPKNNIDSTYVWWKFNQEKFKSIIQPILDKKADEYFKSEAHRLVRWFGSLNVSTLVSEESKVKNVDREIKKYEGYWVVISPDDKKIVEIKKNHIQILKDYRDVSAEMDGKMTALIVRLNNIKDNPSYNELAKFLNDLKDKNVRSEKTGKKVYDVYRKIANGDMKYNQLMERWRVVAIKYKPIELK